MFFFVSFTVSSHIFLSHGFFSCALLLCVCVWERMRVYFAFQLLFPFHLLAFLRSSVTIYTYNMWMCVRHTHTHAANDTQTQTHTQTQARQHAYAKRSHISCIALYSHSLSDILTGFSTYCWCGSFRFGWLLEAINFFFFSDIDN